MARAEAPDDLVILARVGDLTTAQLLCGRLEADGIAATLPDEHVATQNWHLSGAMGGIRIQVRRADLERAKDIMAQPGGPDLLAAGDPPASAAPVGPNGEADDGTISEGDRAAFRSLRVALVSLWLMGLFHPYSLWLSLRALGRPDVTAWGKRRAAIALVVSLVGCVGLGLLVHWFYRLRS